MFGKKQSKEIDIKKINEVTDLSSKVLKVLYLLLIVAALYVAIRVFKETKLLDVLFTILKIAIPLFIGLLVAWLFDPFVRWLEGHKIKRTLGAVITYLIIFLVIFLVLVTLIPLLTDQVKEFIKIAPSVFDSIKTFCVDLLNHLNGTGVNVNDIKNQFFDNFEGIVTGITQTLPTTIINFVSGLFSGIGTFVLGMIIGFFLIVSFDNSSALFNFIPKNIRKTSIELFNNINYSLRRYVKGAIIDCSVIFILTSIGLWLIGLKAPALFGFFCGLTNIIPYAGPYIGGAPAAIVGFTQSPTIGILTICVIAVIQFLEGNFLQPLIMSKTTKLHPVSIMLGLLVFGYFFGIVGMLLSTPILAVLKTVFQFFDKKYGLLNYTSDDVSENIDH